VGQAAAIEHQGRALGRNSPVGHGAQRFRQDQHDRGLVLEQRHVDAPSGAEEDAMPVTHFLAANGPVPAPLSIGFDVLALPVLGRGPAAMALLVVEIRLLVFVLMHLDSPQLEIP